MQQDRGYLRDFVVECTGDRITPLPAHRTHTARTTCRQVQYIAGGATQNSIRVAQWMLKEPNMTGFMGSVGKDEYGDKLSACAQADGVDVHYFVEPETPTGTCAVLVTSANR